MTIEPSASHLESEQNDLLTANPTIVDGERDIRIPFGPRFFCKFDQSRGGLASATSDHFLAAPRQIFALAEGIRHSLLEVHHKLGHNVTYEVKETILQLPNSEQASRYVSVAQTAGESLQEDVRRAVVERFCEQCFTAKYSLREPTDEVVVIPAEAFEAMMRGDTDYVLPEIETTKRGLDIHDVLDLEGLVADAVATPALNFARANAGKQVQCLVVTPAGNLEIIGIAARPESRWESAGPITLVRQIDGLAISGHKVDFAMPNISFNGSDDRSGNGPEPMPDNFVAAIGKGEESDVPPEPLLTQVREYIGSNTLLVRIRVEVVAVGAKIGYQLVHMERVRLPEFYEVPLVDFQ
ncbi:hypothetical protein [Hydrogenophaga sp. ANAO-22]|jgi:hypothetical protein|uniref:hypothetical protein n=1 Tax=Hydrogenophaga sp. ANAO-22 TaxID=3166645 RepID=UPI0036D41AA8